MSDDGAAMLANAEARAFDVIRGATPNFVDDFRIAKQLAGAQRFDIARRLAAVVEAKLQAPDVESDIEIRQKLALWTSKNADAPDDGKHDEALSILDRIRECDAGADLDTSNDPETLGIAGGICKRKWAVTGNLSDLHQSREYYLRGCADQIDAKDGYPAINAAFVSDMLAVQVPAQGASLRRAANDLREELLAASVGEDWTDLPPLVDAQFEQPWIAETIAEAYFGLEFFDHAANILAERYQRKPCEPWEYETTARQFAWLAQLVDGDDFDNSAAWRALKRVYGDAQADAVRSIFAGKLGLALSGGGFRASYFHIGVLAALAERDLLRHVEVLSCVSGGSLLGAAYYLAIKELLETRDNGKIERSDYVRLVKDLAKNFDQGVRSNIRMRIGANPVSLVKLLLKPGYTVSSRLAELYQEELYQRYADGQPIRMRDLKIAPESRLDENNAARMGSQNPKYDNWKLRHKIPILVLNATSLNTGHNWQFTASWMGEPPNFIDREIDKNYRLRRMYYNETGVPEAHCNLTLGTAAAASAAVPGLFPPVELKGLYQDNVQVRLVDGGVYDNQGVYGLLEQDCQSMIVSDASGQMGSQDDPSDRPLSVLMRTTSILQSRVRTAIYGEISARKRSGRLKNLLFLHLKKDLDHDDKDWVGCENPKQLTADELHAQRDELLPYGIVKRLQRKIAGIRTDLDSFNRAEANALMASGYRSAACYLGDEINGFGAQPVPEEWDFLSIGNELKASQTGPLDRLLEIAGQGIFKVWELPGFWRFAKIGVGSVILAFIALLIVQGFATNAAWWRLLVAQLSIGGFIGFVGICVVQFLHRRGLLPKTPNQLLTGMLWSVIGLPARLHSKLLDRFYLAAGDKAEK